jgi:hypothetical protein
VFGESTSGCFSGNNCYGAVPQQILINSQGAAFQAAVQAACSCFHELFLLFFQNSHDDFLYFSLVIH